MKLNISEQNERIDISNDIGIKNSVVNAIQMYDSIVRYNYKFQNWGKYIVFNKDNKKWYIGPFIKNKRIIFIPINKKIQQVNVKNGNPIVPNEWLDLIIN